MIASVPSPAELSTTTTTTSNQTNKLSATTTSNRTNNEGATTTKMKKKKKQMRRERAIERMKAKGVDIDLYQRERREKEEARRKRLIDFFPSPDSEWKHRLEIRTVAVGSLEFEMAFEESFHLFKRYQESIHDDKDKSEHGYRRFLAETPLSEEDGEPFGSYHQHYLLDGKLIAVGVVDVLSRCLSAKYLFYDPDYAFLSLGTYTALREIHYTEELSRVHPQLHYYYMGYYIHSCAKMRYKARFRPSDLLCDETWTWIPLSECLQRLNQEKKPPRFAPSDVPSTTPSVELDEVPCLVRGRIVLYGRVRRQLNQDDQLRSYVSMVGPVARSLILHRRSVVEE